MPVFLSFDSFIFFLLFVRYAFVFQSYVSVDDTYCLSLDLAWNEYIFCW